MVASRPPLNPGSVDDEMYALTEHGRALRLVDGEHTDTSIIGASARCGRRMRRFVHPSDHREGRANICADCQNRGPKQ